MWGEMWGMVFDFSLLTDKLRLAMLRLNHTAFRAFS